MINPNEAVKLMKQYHDNAYQEAREKWVPYWMYILDRSIRNNASHGRGETKLSLNWVKHLGASHMPNELVQKYTERILDEELAQYTGYRIVKINRMCAGTAIPEYQVIWFSDSYDAYKADKELEREW